MKNTQPITRLVQADTSTPCEPAFLTIWSKRRNGWKAGTVTVQCQHGHAYTVIQPKEWAGSIWEANADKYTIAVMN